MVPSKGGTETNSNRNEEESVETSFSFWPPVYFRFLSLEILSMKNEMEKHALEYGSMTSGASAN